MNSQGQLTFLLVDHDQSRLDSSATYLQSMGYYNYLQAEDGAEAWAMFKSFNVDFVIAAMNISELNGIALLKVVRSHEDYASTPFILMSEEVTSKLVFRAGRLGVSDILVTPFTPDVFQKKIQDIMAIENEPQNQEVERNLKRGRDLLKAGKYEESLKVFEDILSVHEDAEVYFNMGYIKSAKGEYEEALACFRQATKINNDFAKAYSMMAEVYSKIGNVEEAESYYSYAAEIYMDRKQDTEAEEAFEAVVRLKPDTTNVYNSLGILYRRQKRFTDAAKMYEKALKVHPRDENIYFNLSRVYLEMGEKGKAGQALSQSLELNPDFAPARELARVVELGFTL